ncbi:MAG: 2-oxoacid:acceptor oxidoreductase family protein [Spirochaetota bacterium]
MHEEMIIAGFGGQGIMLLGKLLAEACMEEGRNVSWLPSYGPEMRGGTANCHVIVSDEDIGSPIIVNGTLLVAMNRPSLEKFEDTLVRGGTVFLNSSIIDTNPRRGDVLVHRVRANHLADELGNLKTANMVMAGAVIGVTNLVSVEVMKSVVRENLTGKKADLVPLNLQALARGMEAVLSGGPV